MNPTWNLKQQYAAAYFQFGWIPIPLCWPNEQGGCGCPKRHTNPKDIGKAPLLGNGYQSYKPKTIEQVVAPWRTNPDANIGILLEPSQLFLLDLDSAEAIQEALKLGMHTMTPTVRRGDHEHRYFINPGVECRRSTRRGESKAIDVLALGYVVAPPSLHQSGDLYTWMVAPEEFAIDLDVIELPVAYPQSWMLKMLDEVVEKRKQDATVHLASTSLDITADFKKLDAKLQRRIIHAFGDGGNEEDRVKFGEDRSRLVMSVIDSLLWRGWNDDQIAAVLLHPQYMISERMLAKPDPLTYVVAELTRARQSFDEKKGKRSSNEKQTTAKPPLEVLQGGKTEGSSAVQPEPSPKFNSLNEPDTIVPGDNFLQENAAKAWAIIHRKNTPPRLFRRHRTVAKVWQREDGMASVLDLNESAFRGELARNVYWLHVYTEKKNIIEKPIDPPLTVVKDMMAIIDDQLPVLNGISYVPVFSRSGTLNTDEGYQPETRLYYVSNGLVVPTVSPSPTEDEVAAARSLFLNELFADFPLANDASLANLMAATLLPFVRPMIDGPAPFHLIDAPTKGSGKTKLAKLIGQLVLGRDIRTISGAKSDEEWDKRILSILRDGPPVILLDNLEGNIDFPSLNNAATTTTFSARLLGKSEMAEFPNLATWLLTGNNVDVSGDVIRRICWIRLDAKMENPAERKEFKREAIESFLAENRDSFIWAALTMIQNWISLGCPAGTRSLGSFESWARVMGGILDAAGIPGFLGNKEELLASSDPEGDEWREFVEAWWISKWDDDVSAGDLFKIAEDKNLLVSIWGEKLRKPGQLIAFGKALRRKSGAVIHDKQISFRKVRTSNLYRLIRL